MKKELTLKLLALTCLFAASASSLLAGTGSADLKKTITAPDLFTEDRIEIQGLSGVLFSKTGVGPDVPEFNTIQENVRIGWMLTSPGDCDSFFRGNVEALLELSGNGVLKSFGGYLVGPAALVRYNFVQPNWKVVPYVQGGAGVVFGDPYLDETQRAIGQFFEFTPQASAGLRYMLDDNWSIDAEAMFHHISNASTAARNLGVNQLGGFVGFSYMFGNLWK